MILNFWTAILIGLTLGWVGLMYWAIKEDEANLFGGFLMYGVILMLVLWGPISWIYHARTITREVPVKVNVLESSIILTSDGVPIYTITTVPEYNKFKGLTNAVIVQEGYVDVYDNTNYGNYRLN